MKFTRALLLLCCTQIILLVVAMNGQPAANSSTPAAVPRLVNFSGKAINDQGKAVVGIVGITCSIYKDQYEGAPLWMETQNVNADARGNYTVQLEAMSTEGLPLDLFTSGEARWLGVRLNGGEEQPRVLLLSVPYALKAADAQTLGGLPASAFMLAAPASGAAPAALSNAASDVVQPAVAGSGTADYVPLWTPNGSTLGDSVVFQSGTGTAAKIGINTKTPASTLDVNGAGTVRGNLSLPATGTATAAAGKNSQPATLTASAYNSTSKAAVAQNFRWQAEPAGNNTATPSGTVNLLYSSGTAAAAETGLKINSKGQLTFARGQTFPGTGAGTITGVSAGTGLSGGGSSGNVTLNNTGLLGLTAGTGIAVGSGQTPTVSVSGVPLLGANNLFAGSNAPGITQMNGSVGIGTYSPDNTLTVNGSADKPGGGSWGTYSDRRLKTLDGAFSAGLSQIMKINPVHYRYKEDNAMGIHDTSEHVGLVAQEVQKIIPEAVTENSKGYLLVNNDPIIWTMLNAIKEQQRLIRQERVQVQLQQAKIDQLTRQVRAVQAALKASRRPDAEVQTASAIAPVIHH
jgi:Chaperone of endosialidase